MVAKAGLEPALLYRKSILSRQRLPIPPLGLCKLISILIIKLIIISQVLSKKSFNFSNSIFN